MTQANEQAAELERTSLGVRADHVYTEDLGSAVDDDQRDAPSPADADRLLARTGRHDQESIDLPL